MATFLMNNVAATPKRGASPRRSESGLFSGVVTISLPAKLPRMSSSTLLTEKNVVRRRLWTHAELCAEMEVTNEFIELWDGHLIISPTPQFPHYRVVQRLEDALRRYVERRKLGLVFHAPLDVVFSPTLVLQPDIFFIYRNRLNIVKDYVYGPPDLVIEVFRLTGRVMTTKTKKKNTRLTVCMRITHALSSCC